MKNYKKYLILGIIPFLAGCDFSKLDIFGWFKKDEPKGDLVIPTVDVESLQINLPNKPTRSTAQSDIKTDGTYDYFNFYEVSDVHGAIDYEVGSSSTNLGLPKMASYFETLRNTNKAGTILLSSGDMYQGSAESNLTRGYLVNYCMNYMGFESMTIGNHEFDWGASWIEKNSNLKYNNYSIPFLGANIIENATGAIPSYLKKSVVIQRGDYKIGIVGTIGSELKNSILKSNVDPFTFTDEEVAAKDEAKALKQNGCDIVIWSSHNDVEILSKCGLSKTDGIDAVFGGHAHENNKKDINGIPVIATANYGRGIASVELKINKTSKEVTCSAFDVTPTSNNTAAKNATEDSNIKSIISQYSTEIDKIKNIKLGSTKVDLTNTTSGALKDVCVDTMQLSAKNFVKENSELNIDADLLVAAYHNINGGIRDNIKAGTITYGDVYKPFPFDNEIVLFKATGQEISKLSKNDLMGYAFWHSFKRDKTDLDMSKEYYVITTDFIALGEKLQKTDEDLIRTGLNVRDEIAKYIYAKDVIDVNSYDVDQFKPLSVLPF